MNTIQIVHKTNKQAWDILIEFGLYEKYANDEKDSVYVTPEQYALGYVIQELGRLEEAINGL